MKITPNSASIFAPCVMGETCPPYRSARELVTLFNEFGMDDYYDPTNGGLPKLGKSELNTARKDYSIDRMQKLEVTQTLDFLHHVLNNAEDKDLALKLFNKAFQKSGLTASEETDGIVIHGLTLSNTQNTASSAHFRFIEQKVLDAIDQARVMIWIAMAWFTNDVIYQKLLEKLHAGVEIRLILFKDGVNQTHGVDPTPFEHKEIRGTRGGIMHNKFCVIDNQFVITGSYNWSTNAETRNDENVLLIEDINRASDFSIEFKRLWNHS